MRTDIHRPSAAEFDPQAYDLRGVFDLNPDPVYGAHERKARMETVNAALAEGYRFASHQHTGQCGHCGARIRYAALMVREDAHEMIWIGEICLDGRFEMTKGEFDRLRKQAKLDRDRQRLLTAWNKLVAEHPAYAYATYAQNILHSARKSLAEVIGSAAADNAMIYSGIESKAITMTDMAHKARKYGDPSEKAINYLTSLVEGFEAKINAVVEREMAKVNAKANAPALEAGRYTVEGVVVSIKETPDPFSYYPRTVFKMLVALDGGQRVFGTMPAALHAWKGDRVSFVAQVKPKDEDPTFGYFSRPTKAIVVAEGPRNAA